MVAVGAEESISGLLIDPEDGGSVKDALHETEDDDGDGGASDGGPESLAPEIVGDEIGGNDEGGSEGGYPFEGEEGGGFVHAAGEGWIGRGEFDKLPEGVVVIEVGVVPHPGSLEEEEKPEDKREKRNKRSTLVDDPGHKVEPEAGPEEFIEERNGPSGGASIGPGSEDENGAEAAAGKGDHWLVSHVVEGSQFVGDAKGFMPGLVSGIL